jgi:hypothetical protein
VPEKRQRLIASVMAELRGYIDAVDDFETSIAQRFGLGRRDLRWFTALRDPDGVARGELETLGGEDLGEKLQRLHDDGHVSERDGVVHASPAARELLAEVFAPVQAAEAGLHRYAADELAIVRNFLRVGREFYARQLRRFARRELQ